MRTHAAFFQLLAIWPLISIGAQADVGYTKPVWTKHGPIIGVIDSATNVKIFKGVPYGADTRQTRFKPPIEPGTWKEPRLCTKYGDISVQQPDVEYAGLVQSEDCLNLNIWTPALDKGKRPVLVWFHPGAFSSMSSNDPTSDGTKLAANKNVVVVSVNHRIGGFGYLNLGGVSDAYKIANAGQLDLILALKWVRDNIDSFGGDRNLVTIFGQSGGGAKSATLMAMPAAKGLFHRVWTMSGQQITGRTYQHAKETAQAVLARLPGNGTVADKIQTLESLSTTELRTILSGSSSWWTPVVEPDTGTLPRDPFSPTANEQSRHIPMVMGNVYDETRNLIGGGNATLFNLTWADVPPALAKNIPQYIGNMTTEYIVEQYRKQYPGYSPSDVFFASTTAARSWKSMVVQVNARAAQKNSPFWVYYFNWKSPYEGGKWGAAHGYDIPFVFDNPDATKETRGFRGVDELADSMSTLLVNFAKYGDPNMRGRDSEKYGRIPKWRGMI